MTSPLADPAGPLLALVEAIGLAPALLASREKAATLTLHRDEVASDRVSALSLDLVRHVVDTYGDALSMEFFLDQLSVLTLSATLDEASLDVFREAVAGSPTVRLNLTLDKGRLLDRWYGGTPPHTRLFLYLFPEAAARLFGGDIDALEAALWRGDDASKVIVLVPAAALHLRGVWLSVIGGASVATWVDEAPAHPLDVARPTHLRAVRAELLSWQDLPLMRLTPLHLATWGEVSPHDKDAQALAAALWSQLVNLAILYTANRAAGGGDHRTGMTASYSSSKVSRDLVLTEPATAALPPMDRTRALVSLVEWIYDPLWSSSRSADRLSLVQTSIAAALGSTERAARYAALIDRAPLVLNEVQALWQSFIDERIDEYVAGVRDLEDYVDKTAQSLADQMADLVKGVSDTALAAAAAVLGSLIATFVDGKTTSRVFTVGMVLYAVYVLCFPLGYNMYTRWGLYQSLRTGFSARRARYERRLSVETVKEIVGWRVDEAEHRFRRTFIATIVIYLVVAALALGAAVVVPPLLTSR